MTSIGDVVKLSMLIWNEEKLKFIPDKYHIFEEVETWIVTRKVRPQCLKRNISMD